MIRKAHHSKFDKVSFTLFISSSRLQSVMVGPRSELCWAYHCLYSATDTALGSVVLIQGQPVPRAGWLGSELIMRFRRPRFLQKK